MDSKRKKEYFKRVYQNIEQNGFHTTYVMEEIGFTPFGYSTGIYKNFNIPELFISGLPGNLTGELIQNYVDEFKFKNVPINNKISHLTNRFVVYFINVENNNLKDYVLTSTKFYENTNYEYLQLIFPDLNGNFPNEENYDYDQTIFGNLE